MMPAEAFTEAQRYTALNYAINGEIKALTGVVVAQYPKEELISQSIYGALRRMQGNPPVWATRHMTADCLQSLAKGRIIREYVQPVGEPTIYRIGEGWRHRLASVCGVALEWTLKPEHEDIGLANLLGRSGEPGQNQAPTTRYQMIDHLLDNPGVSPTDIWEAIGPKQYKQNSIQNHVRRLGLLGVLAITSRIIDYNPDVSIKHQILRYRERTDAGLHSLVASTLREVYLRKDEPFVTISLRDLIQRCYEREPDWDLNDIRRQIISMFHHATPEGWGIILEPDEHPTKIYTASVHPRFRGPLRALREGLKSLADSKACDHYARVATEITSDTNAVRYIAEKGLRFSVHRVRKSGEEPLRQQVLKTARAIGPATVRHIMAELRNQGLRPDTTTVSAYLVEFAAKGALLTTTGRRDPTTRREVIYYSAPEAEAR